LATVEPTWKFSKSSYFESEVWKLRTLPGLLFQQPVAGEKEDFEEVLMAGKTRLKSSLQEICANGLQ